MTRSSRSKRVERPRGAGPLRVVAGLLSFVFLVLLLFRAGSLLTANASPNLSGVVPDQAMAAPRATPAAATTPVALQVTPSASAAASQPTHAVATRTMIPTPTTVSVRLVVDRALRERYAGYFDTLGARFPGLDLFTSAGHSDLDEALVMRTSQGLLFEAHDPPEGAILVREEPFAAIANVQSDIDGFTLTQLVGLARGQDQTYRMVCGDDGGVVRAVLEIDDLARDAELLDGWTAVVDHVAAHVDAWAIVPWEAIDYHVRTVTVDGVRLFPGQSRSYPLIRRTWLLGVQTLPQEVTNDLLAALHYRSAPAIELVAVGDIMLGRGVGERMEQVATTYPFDGNGIRAVLAGSDIAFGNLEAPISDGGTQQTKTYTFRADPSAVDALLVAGLDVLSLANNHSGDYADEALLDTLDALESAGIQPVGAGRTLDEATAARVVHVNGLALAFLAYNQIGPTSFVATADSPGNAPMDADLMVAGVKDAAKEADLVIVSCHWGNEYASVPTATQLDLAKKLADAGAALVLGHHPHVMQGLHYMDHTLVAYSLGNFVFDMFAGDRSQGCILRCLLDVSGVKTVELIPYVIDDGQPQLVQGDQAASLCKKMLDLSTVYGGLPALAEDGSSE